MKINEIFGSWKDKEHNVVRGSILGTPLFNVHLCDHFYLPKDLNIASYADDTTICTVKENKESVINSLKRSPLTFF